MITHIIKISNIRGIMVVYKIVQCTQCGRDSSLNFHVILRWNKEYAEVMLQDAKNLLNDILSGCMVKVEQFPWICRPANMSVSDSMNYLLNTYHICACPHSAR